MKSVPKSLGMLVVGIAIGSLPYTLSMGRINAQDTSRLKPKHLSVQPELVTAGDGAVYLFYQGRVMRMSTGTMPVNQWQKLPDVPRD